jgi:hypothetical protein
VVDFQSNPCLTGFVVSAAETGELFAFLPVIPGVAYRQRVKEI